MAKNVAGVVAALLGGAIAGAATALLFAPKSGKELRKQIADIAREQGAKLNKEELESLISKVVAKVKDLCNLEEIEEAVKEELGEEETASAEDKAVKA